MTKVIFGSKTRISGDLGRAVGESLKVPLLAKSKGWASD